MFHPASLDQITRFSPVTPPPGTAADCVRATRLVPTWACVLPLHSSLRDIYTSPTAAIGDRSQQHMRTCSSEQKKFMIHKHTNKTCHCYACFKSSAAKRFRKRPLTNKSVRINNNKVFIALYSFVVWKEFHICESGMRTKHVDFNWWCLQVLPSNSYIVASTGSGSRITMVT